LQVDQDFINALEDKLSSFRLQPYRDYFNCTNDAEALGVYQWNKAVSTAFYPLLQAVEVTLRNSIHNAARLHFSGNSEWFKMNKFPNAKQFVERLVYKQSGSWIIPAPSANDAVSKLTFGFWVTLLTSTYDDPVNNSKLWPILIPIAFPNASGFKATRAFIHHRFDFIKDFRNRVSHHEPLWKIQDIIDGGGVILQTGPTTPEESILRLQEYIDLILEALQWLSLERHQFLINSGIADHLRAICSLDALEKYQGITNNTYNLNKFKNEIIKKKINEDLISGFYSFNTSPKGIFKGETLIMDVRHLKPLKYPITELQ
jgi:hypothetical protein